MGAMHAPVMEQQGRPLAGTNLEESSPLVDRGWSPGLVPASWLCHASNWR